MDNQREFYQKLLVTFQLEAQEHREAMASGLLDLEHAPESQRADIVERIFRASHSLKGAARAVNLEALETACHRLENVFVRWKHFGAPAETSAYDGLHRAMDLVSRLIGLGNEAESGAAADEARDLLRQLNVLTEGETPSSLAPGPATHAKASGASGQEGKETTGGNSRESLSGDTISRLEMIREMVRREASGIKPVETAAALNGSETVPETGPATTWLPPPAPVAPDTVKVSVNKLDNLLLQAEELLAIKQVMNFLGRDLPRLCGRCQEWKKAWGRFQPVMRESQKKVSGNGARDPMEIIRQLTEFLEWNHQFVEALGGELAQDAQATGQNLRSATVLIDSLIEDMKKVLMRPFASILDGMPRMARDLARSLGKEVEFINRCGEIEMERQILEELRAPLTHLVRNCVDHGIELPAVRQAKGKKSKGAITVSLAQLGSREVQLSVADDGAGMDLDGMRAAALEIGLVDPEQSGALDDQAAINLAFQSGFSTRSAVTNLSGRGLGLAIVREKVEKLGGRIKVETKAREGTTFHIRLPTTRATFRGVLARVGDEVFIFPTHSVERVVRVDPAEIQTVEGRETIRLGGRLVALVWLRELLEAGLVRPALEKTKFPAVVVTAQGHTMAFAVQEILNEHEVLVKSLGPQLLRVRNIEGATLLEDGRLALILHVGDLLRSAMASAPGVSQRVRSEPAAGAPASKRILVVEDSITSRMLIKNILEGAHYEVQTAVDGMDGFLKLRDGHYDLVVTDVEMPRLHGFDLTARIRADQKLAGLPVVLLTGRDSREDLEKGIEVGASAYIVKSHFDQGNLLEVINRLV